MSAEERLPDLPRLLPLVEWLPSRRRCGDDQGGSLPGVERVRLGPGPQQELDHRPVDLPSTGLVQRRPAVHPPRLVHIDAMVQQRLDRRDGTGTNGDQEGGSALGRLGAWIRSGRQQAFHGRGPVGHRGVHQGRLPAPVPDVDVGASIQEHSDRLVVSGPCRDHEQCVPRGVVAGHRWHVHVQALVHQPGEPTEPAGGRRLDGAVVQVHTLKVTHPDEHGARDADRQDHCPYRRAGGEADFRISIEAGPVHGVSRSGLK
jgi:hypothetical protein